MDDSVDQFNDDLIAEGDRALARVTYRGTHLAPFWTIPPTGKRMEVSELLLVRVENGWLAEAWEAYDEFGRISQLG